MAGGIREFSFRRPDEAGPQQGRAQFGEHKVRLTSPLSSEVVHRLCEARDADRAWPFRKRRERAALLLPSVMTILAFIASPSECEYPCRRHTETLRVRDRSYARGMAKPGKEGKRRATSTLGVTSAHPRGYRCRPGAAHGRDTNGFPRR